MTRNRPCWSVVILVTTVPPGVSIKIRRLGTAFGGHGCSAVSTGHVGPATTAPIKIPVEADVGEHDWVEPACAPGQVGLATTVAFALPTTVAFALPGGMTPAFPAAQAARPTSMPAMRLQLSTCQILRCPLC